MASGEDPTKLSMPHVFLVRMIVFLALAAFIAFVLHKQIERAFMANPGLNGLILGVLAVGVVMALAAVVRLVGEVRWANGADGDPAAPAPRLLAPMAALMRSGTGLTTATLRAILDSVSTRLDEQRETLRYMTGLLIFLGLLGTFWGLLETVGSISDVINAMKGGGDSTVMFEDLKNGIAKPLAGMSLSFTASLFGLAGSLVLGFLDLQVGQAQNRFYTELEDRLSLRAEAAVAVTTDGQPDIRAALDKIAGAADGASARAATQAMASLAEGVQALVQHMRSEQQMIRNWVEQQAEQNREVKRTLERLADRPPADKDKG